MAAKELAPLIVLIGQTASGKSALAMQLAKQYSGEIIAADSRTIYKGMDIGTAKPGPEDRAKVPHHLLDIVEPGQPFTAADFKQLADQAITNIASRHKLPILVGGSGLYIDGLIYDFQFMPMTDAALRQELNQMSTEELHELAASKGLDRHEVMSNPRHLIRLIETDGQTPVKQALRANTLILGLKIDREQLWQNIEARVKKMLQAGLRSEVESLAKEYGWDNEAMKGVGYRQWRELTEGQAILDEVEQAIIKDTKAYAKRQMTWFKRDQNIHWVENYTSAQKLVAQFLNKN